MEDCLLSIHTIWARLGGDVVGRLLLFRSECALTDEAEGGVGFLKLAVEGDTFVEHKAFTIIMLMSAIFEILEDAAFQLVDVLEADSLHVRPRFLAAYSACAEHDYRCLLDLRLPL